MKLPKELTTVTRLSKALALTLFITLPILAFSFGMKYQKGIDEQKIQSSITPPIIEEPVACTLDARECPDGTVVGRVPPDCEFEACPTPENKMMCGGIEGRSCPRGYYCKYDGAYPDATGVCKKDKTTRFVCPKGGYVDCMPGPRSQESEQCSSEYLQWAQENCPDFQGAAY